MSRTSDEIFHFRTEVISERARLSMNLRMWWYFTASAMTIYIYTYACIYVHNCLLRVQYSYHLSLHSNHNYLVASSLSSYISVSALFEKL